MKFLLITHGNLAEGLLHSAKMLIGELKEVDFISFKETMGNEDLELLITNYINDNQSKELLIFTDILGGTPFNLSTLAAFEKNNIAILYGINLPTFIECYMNKDILRKIRFHDLRHSCASLLLAKRIPMKEIQDWLGHSTYSTTANIYAHLEKDTKNKSANVLSNVLTFTE